MDLTDFDDEALDDLRRDVLNEQERRATISQAPGQAEMLAKKYLAAMGEPETDDPLEAMKVSLSPKKIKEAKKNG